MGKRSSRFSTATRQTGGGSYGISHTPSKKLKKLSSVGEMDQSSPSTSSKRVKLPKKFFDDCDDVNRASVPRKLRSAMKKRHHESVTPSSPNHSNGNCRFEIASKDHNTKCKVHVDKRHPTMSESITEKITEDEEEVIAALLVLETGMFPANVNTEELNLNNEISAAEASTLQEKPDSKRTCGTSTASKLKDLVRTSVQIEDLNETAHTVGVKKDSKDGKKSRKRCSSHVYICRLIKDLQAKPEPIKETVQRAYVDAKPDTTRENVMNGYADKISDKTRSGYKTMFEDQWHTFGVQQASSRSVAQNYTSVPVTYHSGGGQVPVLPFFGNPLYDPSQWARPLFPKQQQQQQQMWMNPFISGSKDARKTQFGHRASGYDENGGLFLVDNSPTLKLTLR